MKTILSLLFTLLIISACEKNSISSTLVGKWNPSYQYQSKNADGSWGPWLTMNTLVAVVDMEFTADGRYLRGGQDGSVCCGPGSKYKVSEDKVIFSDFKSCSNVYCISFCTEWIFTIIEDNNTLIVESCGSRSKFFRNR